MALRAFPGKELAGEHDIIAAVKRLAALLLVFLPSLAGAQTGLQGFDLRPPCEGTPPPAYGVAGGPPATAVWSEGALNKGAWAAAPCLRWVGGRVRMASALAATLSTPTVDPLLTRFAALSRYKSIRFWSIMYENWEEFVADAGFIDGPQSQNTLPDLKPSDFVAGRELYYFEMSRAGRTVHRMTVRQRTDDRVEIATENVMPIRFAKATLFDTGALQTVTFLDRRGPDQWGYFQTIGVGMESSFFAVQSTSPYINRLIALYRYMANIPTDRDPPAARH